MMSPTHIRCFTVILATLILSSCAPRGRAASDRGIEEPEVVLVEEGRDEPETIVIEDEGTMEPGEIKPDLVIETIHFELDRYDIRPGDAAILERNADVLGAYPRAKVLVEGHCCPLGTNEYNMALGWKRANAARDYLKRLGISEGRLTTTSYGEERIIESDPNRYERNRRCEFKASE